MATGAMAGWITLPRHILHFATLIDPLTEERKVPRMFTWVVGVLGLLKMPTITVVATGHHPRRPSPKHRPSDQGKHETAQAKPAQPYLVQGIATEIHDEIPESCAKKSRRSSIDVGVSKKQLLGKSSSDAGWRLAVAALWLANLCDTLRKNSARGLKESRQ